MTVSEWYSKNKPTALEVLLRVKCPDGQTRTISLDDFTYEWIVKPDSVHNWEVVEEMNRD